MARNLIEFDASLPSRIAAALETFKVPGAVIAVTRGDDEFLMTAGVKRYGSADPVLPTTAFDVGSCAKSYVATAVAILATEGKLGLDDLIRRYVPELALDDPWISDHVTIRDFLSNRTGLARQRPIEAFPNPEMSVLDIMARMKNIRRVYPFRGGYVYFNLGFIVCALVVERVSGMSYAGFLARRLFAPLGMTHSASGRQAFDQLAGRASGHTSHGGPTVVLKEMLFENTQGAGCVYSSGEDALRWLRFHVREEGAGLISPPLMRQLHSPHTVMPFNETGLMHRPPEASLCAYCLGWWTSELASRRLVQHAGGMFGWRAQTSFIPGADMGVAVYLNSARTVHHAIAYMVLESILGLPPRNWVGIVENHVDRVAREFTETMEAVYPRKAGEMSLRALGDYEGRYTHPASGEIEIVQSGGGLLVKQLDGRLWDLSLKPLGDDVFEAGFDNIAVRDYLPAPARARFVVEAAKVVAFEEPGTRYDRLNRDSTSGGE